MIALAVIGAITLASYGLIWNKYQHEQDMQAELNLQLDQVWPLVQAGMPETSKDQEERLATARAELENQQAGIPTMLNPTEIMDKLLQIANDHNVIISLQTDQQPAEFGDEQYLKLTSSVNATGSLDDLVTFIQRIENGINTLNLEQQVNFELSDDSWAVDFSFTVYSQLIKQDVG